jgi:hypothetical protein
VEGGRDAIATAPRVVTSRRGEEGEGMCSECLPYHTSKIGNGRVNLCHTSHIAPPQGVRCSSPRNPTRSHPSGDGRKKVCCPWPRARRAFRERPSQRNANFFGSTGSTSVCIPTGLRPRTATQLNGDAQSSPIHNVSEGTKRQVCWGRWGLSKKWRSLPAGPAERNPHLFP